MNIARFLGLGVLITVPLLARTATAEPAASRPVAIVYSLEGEASLAAPGASRRPLRLFERLAAKTTLEVGPGSRLALAFLNGRRYELGERSRVALGRQDLAFRAGPVQPLPPLPPLPGLAPIARADQPGSRAGAVRIRTEPVAGLYPGGGAATLAAATTLRFEPVDGGRTYRVEVHDRQGETVFKTETAASAVTLPPGVLRPGARYGWTVRTVERAGPVAQGKASFLTLSARNSKGREALRQALRGERDPAALALLAEVDWSLGLWAEARDELHTAVEGSPGDARLAANLAERERRLPYRQSP